MEASCMSGADLWFMFWVACGSAAMVCWRIDIAADRIIAAISKREKPDA